jgi:hypothetical protein
MEMAFRTEAAVVVILAQSLFAAEVQHRHLHRGNPGILEVTGDGIEFTEIDKSAKHNRRWKYEQIQQLVLSDKSLTLLSYEDVKWTGRDREWVFDDLPKDFASNYYPVWRDKLDQRFVAAIPDPEVKTLVEFPAKLTGLLKGTQGTLLFAEDRVVFRTAKPGESRTWRFSDIENVASAGPFDFSIVTLEHHGSWNAGGRDFRFQLQRPMEEARFNDLWRRLLKSKTAE